MLKEMNAAQKPQEEELQARLEEARKKLFAQQMQLKEHKLPVLVLFEGWGAAGKGSTIGKIIKNIDPRFFKSCADRFYTVISSRFPKRESLLSWTAAGWRRLRRRC